mmetsp:Transcript_42608/g.104959  ORF Transcript_42608/g.104959 Transcript_42608/m.104959 type:complete len:236 (+) Transcript_42608:2052-2759(+)
MRVWLPSVSTDHTSNVAVGQSARSVGSASSSLSVSDQVGASEQSTVSERTTVCEPTTLNRTYVSGPPASSARGSSAFARKMLACSVARTRGSGRSSARTRNLKGSAPCDIRPKFGSMSSSTLVLAPADGASHAPVESTRLSEIHPLACSALTGNCATARSAPDAPRSETNIDGCSALSTGSGSASASLSFHSATRNLPTATADVNASACVICTRTRTGPTPSGTPAAMYTRRTRL